MTRTSWYLFCGVLVFLMQAGFMLFEAGCVRRINQSGIAIKNLAMLMASMFGYALIGYRLMFGESIGGVIGSFMHPPLSAQHGDDWRFLQMGFAIISATILSGALAGRSQLRANVFGALAVTVLVFPVVGHWVWGGGWLTGKVHDFAGSGVVHVVGGMTALVAAWAAGPREERCYLQRDRHGQRRLLRSDPRKRDGGVACPPLGPRDLTLASYGLILLMVGWMGFNGGNLHTIPSHPNIIGRFFLSTCLAAVGGMFTVMIVDRLPKGVLGRSFLVDPHGALAGGMAGMVAVTAVCDVLPKAWFGLVMGVAGALAYWVAARIVLYVLQVDDPVDAVAVHVGGGLVGVGAAPMFVPSAQPEWQIIYAVSTCVFTAAVMATVFLGLDALGWLRCPDEDEQQGLAYCSDGSLQWKDDEDWKASQAASGGEREFRVPRLQWDDDLAPYFGPERVPRLIKRVFAVVAAALPPLALAIRVLLDAIRIMLPKGS